MRFSITSRCRKQTASLAKQLLGVLCRFQARNGHCHRQALAEQIKDLLLSPQRCGAARGRFAGMQANRDTVRGLRMHGDIVGMSQVR